jgi:hypothetical protein
MDVWLVYGVFRTYGVLAIYIEMEVGMELWC